MNVTPRATIAALERARAPILWIGATYLLGVVVGAGMVHANNQFALSFADSLVGQAQNGKVLKALDQGQHLRAAAMDFGGNLVVGAMPSTVMGLGIVMPFPLIAFRGWVGEIVSVDGEHKSRLRDSHERLDYLGVLFLQLIPYTLAGGTGVRLGWRLSCPKAGGDMLRASAG